MKNWLYRVENKLGRFAVTNLMLYIVCGTALVFFADLFNPAADIIPYLSLTREGLFSGQIWRLVTFLFVPAYSGFGDIFWCLISLYFYYWIGSSLESHWGAARFNLYYFSGAVFTILAALLTGYAGNFFLNMSLFFAFAVLFPDMQVLLFFLIPIKVKWLAWVDAALFAFEFVSGDASVRVTILMCLANFFLFFGPDFFRGIFKDLKYRKTRREWRDQNRWN